MGPERMAVVVLRQQSTLKTRTVGKNTKGWGSRKRSNGHGRLKEVGEGGW